jgi:surface protein
MRKIIILCLALLLAIGLQAQVASPVGGGTVSVDVNNVTETVMNDGTVVVVFPPGANTFNVPEGVTNIEYLLVGGGGGGGYARDRTAGGGSGGRVLSGTLTNLITGGTINVTVGTGGEGGRSVSNPGDAGGSSSLVYDNTTITAPGGGRGGQRSYGPLNGGGAFHGSGNSSYYSNTSFNSYSGGNGQEDTPSCFLGNKRWRFVGGGGAGNNGNGANGVTGTNNCNYYANGGNGGNGFDSTITGQSLGYGGGGGGSVQLWYSCDACHNYSVGTGLDGGGIGGVGFIKRSDFNDNNVDSRHSLQSTTSGVDGRGGGGGGGHSDTEYESGCVGSSCIQNGGDGGDGVVILRYTIPTNPDFYVENGTCKCENAAEGDTGYVIVNGIAGTFTKRTREQIQILLGNNDYEAVQKTCTSGLTDISGLFRNYPNFNEDINHWDVSNVTKMKDMFNGIGQDSNFNQPLNNWDVSNVTDMHGMFEDASAFNQSLDNWDVSNVTDMQDMFYRASAFNQPLNNWDVSNVTSMRGMFYVASAFNQPLNNWDVSNVTNMNGMFQNASAFNQSLDNWEVSNVTDMTSMFRGASVFNQPLNNWDVHSVTGMGYIFQDATAFNQPLNNWDVSNVTSMYNMFYGASAFNQDIGSWDVSNVEYMLSMFYGASAFNQDLSGWCVEEIGTEPSSFSTGSGLDEANKPNWGAACDVTINLDSETLDLAQTKMNTGYDVTLTGTNANINQAMNGSGDLIINTTSLTMSESVNVANLSITTTNGTTFSGTNKTLQASGSMTLNTDMDVTGSLTLDSPSASLAKGKHIEVTGSLTNNATVLELNSGSNEFASMRINGGSISGSGKMAYKRYVNTTPGNDLISPPFAGMTFNDFIGDSNGVLLSGSINGTPGYFLFGPFDTVNNNYVMFNSSTDGNTTLEMGKGYRAGRMTEGFSSEAVVFETPNNYNYTSLTSNLDVQLVGSGSGWNLIGNPYPSYLNLSDVLSNNTASLFGEEFEAIYAYNGDATNPWTIYNSSSGANVKIAPGQAFFVRAAEGGATFSFTPSMQSNTGGDDFIQGRNAAETAVYRAGIELSSSVGSYTTDLYFHPNGSNGLDVGYDAASWQGSAPDYGVYSYLVSDNQGLPIAIQTLHSDALEQGSTVIPLGVEASSGYTLTLGLTDNSYLPESAIVYLEDRNLGSFTNLRTGSYSVSSGSGISGTGRFFIHVSNDATLSNPGEVYSGVQVYSPMGSGMLVVTGVNEPGMRLRLYDIQGRLLLDQGLSAVSMQELPVGTLSTAAVIARLEGAQGSRSVKLIINQK